RKELPNENNGGELAATSMRKQHCQRSADSLRTREFVIRVHGMMDEHPGKSIRNILPNIFKCLKEQQCIRNVLLQHLRYKSYALRRSHFISTRTTQENRLVRAQRLLNKLKHPEEEECLPFFSDETTSTSIKKSNLEIISGYLQVDPTELPTVMHVHEVTTNSDAFRANPDADAYVKTPQTIVIKPPWIDSVANG
ncbi:hypothetical protein ACTXT7_017640, partial [Hymenolepis weldensis]